MDHDHFNTSHVSINLTEIGVYGKEVGRFQYISCFY